MMNRVILTGYLTKDPDLKYTRTGVAVCTVTLAVNRTHGNRDEADFISVVVWRKQAENLANYMRKGGMIGVDGKLHTRNYEGADGKRVYVTEVLADFITFLTRSANSQQSQSNSQFQHAGQWGNQSGSQWGNQGGWQQGQSSNQGNRFGDDPFSGNGQPIDISDDDLPF